VSYRIISCDADADEALLVEQDVDVLDKTTYHNRESLSCLMTKKSRSSKQGTGFFGETKLTVRFFIRTAFVF
jgi:hypothetical protein